MTRCIAKGCNRRRLPHFAHCEGCHRALLVRVFGPVDRLAAA